MNLAKFAVEKQTVTVFTTVLALLAGVASFFTLGQLEDPEFTIKNATVLTTYAGASAEEVELEVTDALEIAIQEMSQVKKIESFSRAGLSYINVEMQASLRSADLPQVWDELRKKVRDAATTLPPGAGTPSVGDDFGDVYGFLLAVVGDGFSSRELEAYVDAMKKELSLVDGVARVETWGVQPQSVIIEVSEARLSTLGLTPLDIASALSDQNVVVDAGGIDLGGSRLRIQTTGEFNDPQDIGDLVIRGATPGATADADQLIRVRDIGEIKRGYVTPPNALMRSNGEPAIGVSITNAPGVNIVELGQRLTDRLAELRADHPVGIEFRSVAWQAVQVDESIQAFLISLLQAVLIVMVVLWAFMGLRTALIVGLCGLLFTIVITFPVMSLWGVDLQRMSLGALIIAMGMMVDNAIVVVDGITVRIQRGMDRTKAAIEAASQPAIPLLGATVIAVLAFYPIYASDEGAGEYCATLFSVVGASLVISWVLAVTITPVVCVWALPAPKAGQGDPYAGGLYKRFRGVLDWALRRRATVVIALVGMLIASGLGFGFVNQMFFPASTRTQFMVDYWAPEGTRIQETSQSLARLEDHIAAQEGVESITSFVGQGPPRFYLPVEPEKPYPSYGQLIVNTDDYAAVERLLAELQPWVETNVPEARVVLRKYGLGPSETWPVQVRISGPAVADPVVLRDIAGEVSAALEASPSAGIVRTNWRQRSPKIVADFDQDNARWTGVGRENIADATRRAYDGLQVGLFREDDKLLPILLRHTEAERARAARGLDLLSVTPMFQSASVPLSQVTDSLDLEWEDPLIWRYDRRRAITVQAVPVGLANELRADALAAIDAVELPPGYDLEWDGEYASSRDAQASLVPGVVPAVLVIAIIVVGLFNAYRPPLIIAMTIPFALIGVTVGLLVTGQPFGFVALLGAMSLAGMMIKNAIVLLDEVNLEKARGSNDYQAVVNAALSRLRPVFLAAATTVLGVIPLLTDVFWVAMAVTIMFGLAFGAVLTMVVVPVFYAMLFKVQLPNDSDAPDAPDQTDDASADTSGDHANTTENDGPAPEVAAPA
ncbi:MAG: efflux RND transporter permease subunit [Planctomycetota bacterium]